MKKKQPLKRERKTILMQQPILDAVLKAFPDEAGVSASYAVNKAVARLLGIEDQVKDPRVSQSEGGKLSRRR